MQDMTLKLQEYCSLRWRGRLGNGARGPRLVPGRRLTQEQRLQRAMDKDLTTDLMPSSWCDSTVGLPKGKGGACRPGMFAADFYPQLPPGRVRQRFRVRLDRERRVGAHNAPRDRCHQHSLGACPTCLRLGKSHLHCCLAGHHQQGYQARRMQLHRCRLHGETQCEPCRRTARGVRHCCEAGHEGHPLIPEQGGKARRLGSRPSTTSSTSTAPEAGGTGEGPQGAGLRPAQAMTQPLPRAAQREQRDRLLRSPGTAGLRTPTRALKKRRQGLAVQGLQGGRRLFMEGPEASSQGTIMTGGPRPLPSVRKGRKAREDT